MNIERFHNEIAMRLGYERIVKNKKITIEVEESDDPWVMLKVQNYPETIRIKASDIINGLNLEVMPAMQGEIRIIAEAVHQAYNEANRPF